jgi:phenylalanyl-tRNA synthetase alpha chain
LSDPLRKLEDSFHAALEKTRDLDSLSELKVRYFGKKGELTSALRSIGELPPPERPMHGEKINQLRVKLESILAERENQLQQVAETKALESGQIDVGLPGRKPQLGTIHPLTQIERKIVRIFQSLGFSVETGPEIETDYYNFEALNFPPEHPARDMQDTIFVEGGLVLRTHTSPVQIRTMERQEPPVHVIIPGRVYRHDNDLRRSPVFHQVEGLTVGPDITFSHLKGTLEAFIHMMFGPDIKARFRPSFFPFTEPSAEVDMQCTLCKGKGCKVCKNSGWVEILGSGMVDPNVFEAVGKTWTSRGAGNPYDPEKISGFAFGLGIERIAMVLYGIDDIRLFYENDVRFLNQFGVSL